MLGKYHHRQAQRSRSLAAAFGAFTQSICAPKPTRQPGIEAAELGIPRKLWLFSIKTEVFQMAQLGFHETMSGYEPSKVGI
jgi:hypothetical protein